MSTTINSLRNELVAKAVEAIATIRAPFPQGPRERESLGRRGEDMGGLLTALTPFAAYAVSQFKARAVLQLKTTTRLKIIIKTLKIHQRGKVVGDIGGGARLRKSWAATESENILKLS